MSIYPTNMLSRSEFSPRRLGLRLLGTTDASMYTVPPDRNAVIDRIFVANNGTSAVTLSLHHVPAGGTATTANGLIHGLSIAGKSYSAIDGPIYLSPCDTVIASASAGSALCLHLYGSESAR